MRKAIWKFGLEVNDTKEIKMPIGAKIISVEFQGDNLCLWAIVDRENAIESRTIVVFGSGQPVPDKRLAHLATVQQPPFIWHVFEEIAK